MKQPPETIYLIPGEDVDGAPCMVWCDDPAPSYACDPAEAVKYIRADKHDEIFELQASTAERAAVTMDQARQIITDLVAFCKQPEIVAATDGAFDPDATIQAAQRFLSGGDQ